MEEARATGRTTRLVDSYVQEFFTRGNQWIYIKDHTDTRESNRMVMMKGVQRLSSEHGIFPLIDNKKIAIKMK